MTSALQTILPFFLLKKKAMEHLLGGKNQ